MSTYSKYLDDFDDDTGRQNGNDLGLGGDCDDIDLLRYEAAKLRKQRELARFERGEQDRVRREGDYIGQRGGSRAQNSFKPRTDETKWNVHAASGYRDDDYEVLSYRRPQPQRGQYDAGQQHKSTNDGKKSRLASLIKTALLLAAVLLVCWYTAIAIITKDMNVVKVDTTWDDPAPSAVADIKVRSSSHVSTVLVLGIDDDGGAGSRSDTIMLVSIDSRSNTIKLCSILRDCYVQIPGHSAAKINSAYAYGGAELAMRTVQSNFRVRIDKFASIDRSSLIAVVEAVGGVDIEITSKEAEQINKHSLSLGPDVSAGLAHLDGRQAVAYASIRKIDSDFNRTGRQRTLINALVAKSKTLSPGKLADLAQVVSGRITTNMGSGKIGSMGLKAIGAIGGEIEQMTIPAEGTFSYESINGASTVVIDLDANVKLLHEFLYGK